VLGVANIRALATGWYHSLALLNDGTVWAWGYNASGQLGDGSTVDRSAPVRVQGLSGIIAISAGTYHSAALRSDGTVWTWGNNYYGQLGDGSDDDRALPVRAQLPAATAIACGGAHTLAVAGGAVYAWGWNSDGQLGDGTRTNHLLPALVPNTSSASRVAAGYIHSLALIGSSVRAWGDNALGQIGNNSTTDALSPVTSQISGVTAIEAGGAHSLARRSDGALWVWGNNAYGGLGDGTTTNRMVPQMVPGVANVTAFSGGYAHTLAQGDYTVPVTLRSATAFSSASASTTRGTVTVAWNTPLDAGRAGNAGNYTVVVNGTAASFFATYNSVANSTVLTITNGLRAGDAITVSWRNMTTSSGTEVSNGSTQVTAR
jgi:alpha-tubulin suppressor-like RCC1 family protein